MIRDIRADWKHWSTAERVLAALFLAVGTIVSGALWLVQLG
jgi:hypothetical protein